jgi:hypothetical protein
MRRLVAFSQVTLDGYFAGPNGDISWAHKDRNDAEWKAFVADNAKGGSLFVKEGMAAAIRNIPSLLARGGRYSTASTRS